MSLDSALSPQYLKRSHTSVKRPTANTVCNYSSASRGIRWYRYEPDSPSPRHRFVDGQRIILVSSNSATRSPDKRRVVSVYVVSQFSFEMLMPHQGKLPRFTSRDLQGLRLGRSGLAQTLMASLCALEGLFRGCAWRAHLSGTHADIGSM